MLSVNNEIWVDIEGYEGLYQISNFGRVRNNKGLIRKTYVINSVYECVDLYRNSKRKKYLIHRLVTNAF